MLREKDEKLAKELNLIVLDDTLKMKRNSVPFDNEQENLKTELNSYKEIILNQSKLILEKDKIIKELKQTLKNQNEVIQNLQIEISNLNDDNELLEMIIDKIKERKSK